MSAACDRRAVVLVRRGDPEIAGAIAEGVMRAEASRLPAPNDRRRVDRALLRVAVGNTKTNEDYEVLIVQARWDYGQPKRRGPIRRIGEKLLVAYAMACIAVRAVYRSQDGILGGR